MSPTERLRPAPAPSFPTLAGHAACVGSRRWAPARRLASCGRVSSKAPGARAAAGRLPRRRGQPERGVRPGAAPRVHCGLRTGFAPALRPAARTVGPGRWGGGVAVASPRPGLPLRGYPAGRRRASSGLTLAVLRAPSARGRPLASPRQAPAA